MDFTEISDGDDAIAGRVTAACQHACGLVNHSWAQLGLNEVNVQLRLFGLYENKYCLRLLVCTYVKHKHFT